MDTDLKQQLIYVQMFIKEMAASVKGLEKGMEATSHSINSVEQVLLQVQLDQQLLLQQQRQHLSVQQRLQEQQQQSSRIDHAPSLVQLDNLFRKHLQQVVTQSKTATLAKGDSMPWSLQSTQIGVNDLWHDPVANSFTIGDIDNVLLAQSLTTGGPPTTRPEVKAGAPALNSALRVEMRDELGLLQTSLLKEIKIMQESLHRDFWQERALLIPAMQAALKCPDDISYQPDTLQTPFMNELMALEAQEDRVERQFQQEKPQLIKASDETLHMQAELRFAKALLRISGVTTL